MRTIKIFKYLTGTYCAYCINTAWKKVSLAMIQNCFKKAGIQTNYDCLSQKLRSSYIGDEWNANVLQSNSLLVSTDETSLKNDDEIEGFIETNPES